MRFVSDSINQTQAAYRKRYTKIGLEFQTNLSAEFGGLLGTREAPAAASDHR